MNPPCYQFGSFAAHAPAAGHALFTRHGGVSLPPFASLNLSHAVGDAAERVRGNRARCLAVLGRALPDLIVAGLVHGAAVGVSETCPGEPGVDGSRVIPRVDSLISATPGAVLMITAADCLQILLLDPRVPAIGLVHAGWRGLVAQAIAATVEAMTRQYGTRPDHLLAGVGPGLGLCCAEFTDPQSELPHGFAPFIHGRHVDLRAVAGDQLAQAGLRPGNVEHMNLCTRCRRHEFFSHRGDQGRTGRFGAFLVLQPTAALHGEYL
jgi:YfiH family protein